MNSDQEADVIRRAELDFLTEEALTVAGELCQVYFDLLPYSMEPDGEGTQDPAAWGMCVRALWRARGFTVSSDWRDNRVTLPSGQTARQIRKNGYNSVWTEIPADLIPTYELSEVEALRILRTHFFSIYLTTDMTLDSLMLALASPTPTGSLPLWPDFEQAKLAPVDPNVFIK